MRGWTRVGWWVAVVLLFLFIYRLATQANGDTTFDRNVLPRVSVCLCAVLAGFGAFAFFMRGVKASSAHNLAGVRLQEAGRYRDALTQFELAYQKRAFSLIQFNIGVAKLQLWDLEGAAATLEGLPSTLVAGFRQRADALLAIVAGLRNAPDAWDRVARTPEEQRGAEWSLAAGIVALRKGDDAAARELVLNAATRQLGGPLRALADALGAFIDYRTSGELRPVDRLTLFHETGPERLAAVWPELVEFVEHAPTG